MIPEPRWHSRNSRFEIDAANFSEDIEKKSARGGLFGIGSNVIKVLIQLTFTVILSRILSIDDYGIMAISMSLISFFLMFSDMGAGTATIQKKQVDHRFVSSLFWFGMFSSVIIFIVCFFISEFVTLIFNDDRLKILMIFSSLIIPLGSLGAQHQALMSRQARWIEINILSVFCQILSGLLAIIVAWYLAFGYWALALQSVVATAANTAGLWFLCRWLPSNPSNWLRARESFSYGSYLVLFNVANYGHREADNLIVGQQLGTAALGIYSRGYNLFMLPLTLVVWPIARVIMPLLSRQQDNPGAFARIYCGALASVYLAVAPMAGALFLFAEECVTLLYGEKWIESAEVLRILAVVILLQPAYTSGGWIELSLGRSKRHFYASLVAGCIYILAFAVGVRGGVTGVAKGYLYANMVVVIPWLWWATRGTSIGVSDFFRAIRGSVVALTVSIVAVSFLPFGESDQSFLSLAIRSTCYSLAFVLAAFVYGLADRQWSDLILNTIRS